MIMMPSMVTRPRQSHDRGTHRHHKHVTWGKQIRSPISLILQRRAMPQRTECHTRTPLQCQRPSPPPKWQRRAKPNVPLHGLPRFIKLFDGYYRCENIKIFHKTHSRFQIITSSISRRLFTNAMRPSVLKCVSYWRSFVLANTKENFRLAFRHVSPGTQKADTHAPILNMTYITWFTFRAAEVPLGGEQRIIFLNNNPDRWQWVSWDTKMAT